MILIDTCVWVDHFRRSNPLVVQLVTEGLVLQHPFVTGELAAGTLHPRDRTLLFFRSLPQIAVTKDDHYYDVIDELQLAGVGIGFVDIHLLAVLLVTPGLRLWTTDRRLSLQVERLGLSYVPPSLS